MVTLARRDTREKITVSIDADIVVVKDALDRYGMIELTSTEAKVLLELHYDYLGIINSDDTFVAKDGFNIINKALLVSLI